MVIIIMNKKKLIEKAHSKSFYKLAFCVQKANLKSWLTKHSKNFLTNVK